MHVFRYAVLPSIPLLQTPPDSHNSRPRNRHYLLIPPADFPFHWTFGLQWSYQPVLTTKVTSVKSFTHLSELHSFLIHSYQSVTSFQPPWKLPHDSAWNSKEVVRSSNEKSKQDLFGWTLKIHQGLSMFSFQFQHFKLLVQFDIGLTMRVQGPSPNLLCGGPRG